MDLRDGLSERQPNEGQQLASELVEAQKVRSDLLKWKIGLVAGLAAVGLGVVESGKSGQNYADLVLCAIPLVMAYVDLLCRQLSLRIQVIGDFRRDHESGEYRDYERYAGEAEEAGVFGLDSVALIWSSILVSLALLVLPRSLNPDLPHATEISISGLVGLALAILVEGRYQTLKRRVKALATGDAEPTTT